LLVTLLGLVMLNVCFSLGCGCLGVCFVVYLLIVLRFFIFRFCWMWFLVVLVIVCFRAGLCFCYCVVVLCVFCYVFGVD